MRRKSRIRWIKWGDVNTKYFTAVIKEKIVRKQIVELNTLTGNKITDPKAISDEIITFYRSLMEISAKELPAINSIGRLYTREKKGDNIILSHELVQAYNRKHMSPRCMIKIDLQKDYDRVEWCYLEQVLEELAFPRKFIAWIAECLKIVNYSILGNSEPTEPFDAARGLRQ
ncbi:uncharacterized protein [Nicotiana sylvestris]|uniref:uncharacterized protein n=1 Tax=Nicotiana sylvestris TaxID=4096 RepID=UPI00388CD2E7